MKWSKPEKVFYLTLLAMLAYLTALMLSRISDTFDVVDKCESGGHYYFVLSNGAFVLPYEDELWNYETINIGEKFEIYNIPLPQFLIDVIKGSMSPCLRKES